MYTNTRANIASKLDFTDADLAVLKEVYGKQSLRNIAPKIHKSLGIVQAYIAWLMDNDYIRRTGKGWKNREVTDKGLKLLEKHGYIGKE